MSYNDNRWDYTELEEISPLEASTFKRSCQHALNSELRNQRSLHAISITFLLIAIGVFSLLAGWYWVDIAYLHQGVSSNVVLIGMVVAMILYGVSHTFGILHEESSKACNHLKVSLKSCKTTECETTECETTECGAIRCHETECSSHTEGLDN